MPQILKSVIPVNAKELLKSIEDYRSAEPEDLLYLLYDLNDDILAILPKISSFFAKSSFFSFPSKFVKAFEAFNRRICGYIQEVYIMCTDIENNFSSRSMITDKDALEFWNKFVGEDEYIADYEDFKSYILPYIGKSIYEGSDVIYPPVVTAAKFGSETATGFDALCKRLSYENPFIYKKLNGDTSDESSGSQADSQEASKQMDSKYFFIMSNMITDSKEQLCITVKDDKPGSVVGLTEFNGSFEQQWKIDSKGCIVNRATGLALDIGSRDIEQQKPIIQWSPDGSKTQIFLFGMDGTIRPAACKDGDLCLDDDNGNTGPDSVIILYRIKPGNSNQLWTICPYVESKRKGR